jgi:prepilin-type N-terminal cleavage/methylation domain-containing protein
MIKIKRLNQLNKPQAGFTLIELVVGLLLASLISIAVAMSMGVMFRVNAESSQRVTAVRQVQNAGMWISRDVQVAQTITIGGGGSHFLEVRWTDWDGKKYRVDYDYGTTVTSDLIRKCYVKLVSDPPGYLDDPTTNPTTQNVAAHYIDQANTSIIQSPSVYNLTVTAKIIGFSATGQPVSEKRTYEILPRSSS